MTAIAGEDNIALVANFTFVARDSQTQKAAPVNYQQLKDLKTSPSQTQDEERNVLTMSKLLS